ncbi:MAG: S41 family peptidase [Candidatus Ancaeobacter aquaticus]|nr:S41 family peptidase [Candidatus Ancaeobacter aquaticus]
MTRKRYGRIILSIIFIGTVSLSVSHLYAEEKAKEKKKSDIKELYEKLDVFTDAITIIKRGYVDDVNFKDLIYGAMKGMLKSLDSHSSFMDEDAYKEIQIETEGEFGGLGIEITVRDKVLTIVSPLEGTPAFKKGLRPGDKIVKINGKSTKDITLNGAVKKLRGKPGTPVTITISRPSSKEFIDVTIVRAIIKLQSVKEPKMLKSDIGYIRLTQFQENTDEDMRKNIEDLEKKGIKSLILDLRNNPGGLLQEAIDVADYFIGGNKLIVYTKGRMKEQTVDFKGRYRGTPFQYPVVVLINGGSASGSEIVAGAIQDYKRGVLLGEKSFGKGSVQSVLPLRDGSALKLTTAKYYTPKGRMIHGIGIVPDIVVKISEKDEIKLMLVKMHKLDESGVKLKKPEEVKDEQLERAIDLIEGIKIVNNKVELTEDMLKSEEPKPEDKDKKDDEAQTTDKNENKTKPESDK